MYWVTEGFIYREEGFGLCPVLVGGIFEQEDAGRAVLQEDLRDQSQGTQRCRECSSCRCCGA